MVRLPSLDLEPDHNSLGPLPSSSEHKSCSRRRRETASEERHWRVSEGDNIFIDDSDEEALRTGRMLTAGPSRRSDTPIPSGGIRYIPPPHFGRLSSKERRALAPAEHLVPIEVPDENEESGFQVVPAIDLTEDD